MPTTRGPGKRKTKSPTQATASTSSTQSTQSSQPPKKRSKQQTNNKNKDDGSLIEAVTEAVMSKLTPKLDELFQKSASSAKNDESSSDDSSDEDEIFESGSGRSEIASAISQLVTQGESSSAAKDLLNSSKYIPLTTGIPLESGVDKKLIKKIIGDDYFDLAHLLEKVPGETEITVTIKKKSSSVTANPSKPKLEIRSFENWSTAFHVFIAIYCKAHPELISQLMKYIEDVRDINSEHGFWVAKSYDENFRLHKKSAGLNWGIRNRDLIDSAKSKIRITKNNKNNFREQGNFTKQSIKPVQDGHCFTFANRGKCTRKGCSYIHRCKKCNSDHKPGSTCQ
ncbi:unnamed protein product [Owenia fusiformis]|uniref:C3H1-type domain-containing protein n=1 Tax=Owenia fusiformis TaxID=6347 RepID=A0A8S4PH87_OWEFU|nr:unnamed protein product [Owenia fusiformis]